MRGRKPLPGKLHELHGNPGKRSRSPEVEVEASNGYCPRDLQGVTARKTWRRLAPILSSVGVLTTLDELALGLLCDAVEDYDTASRELREERAKKYPNAKAVSQFRSAKANARRDVISLFAEFGLTPSSRTRLVPTKPGDGDPLADFLAGSGAA